MVGSNLQTKDLQIKELVLGVRAQKTFPHPPEETKLHYLIDKHTNWLLLLLFSLDWNHGSTIS